MFDGWLPTLDLKIRMTEENKCLFLYFEKSMTPDMVLHSRSAMPEATRRSTLNQELIRRMVNTSEMIDMKERVAVIDKYAVKLMNSEYTLEQTRNIIIGGLKGYERLLSLSLDTSNPKWKPLHMSAGWNERNRRIAKQRVKNGWYKGKTEVDPPDRTSSLEEEGHTVRGSRLDTTLTVPVRGKAGKTVKKVGIKSKKKRGPGRESITLGGLKKVEKAQKRRLQSRMRKKMGEQSLPEGWKSKRGSGKLAIIRSVMFVENTAGGVLARRLQEKEIEIGQATGYRIKMAESAGTPLGLLMPSTNPWGAPDCQRPDCVPCKQNDDVRIDCRKRNILYENRCEMCCPKDGKRNRKLCQEDGKGIYVGESSRSLFERAKEHQADRDANSEDSHQVKHWLLDHPELLAPPKFNFSVIKTFQDPLSRQLSEAVRIELRGENILNYKSEFNRCKVPRLRINMKEWMSKKEKESGSKNLAKTIHPDAKDEVPQPECDRCEKEARSVPT